MNQPHPIAARSAPEPFGHHLRACACACAGHILNLPYPQEINDSAAIIGRQVGASEFADMVVDQFDELFEQSRQQPLAMGIALHAMIVGQPFRLRHLRRALEHIASRQADCWLATAGDIARFSRGVIPLPAA